MDKEFDVNQLENVSMIIGDLENKISEILSKYSYGVKTEINIQLNTILVNLNYVKSRLNYVAYMIDKVEKVEKQ